MSDTNEDERVSPLVQIQAQVMVRNDSMGGWLPAGGLALVSIIRRPRPIPDRLAKLTRSLPPSEGSPGSPTSRYCPATIQSDPYVIYGRRVTDETLLINCAICRDFVYHRATPTFHHWRSADQRHGLTFQTSADARAFDRALRCAIHDMLQSLTGCSYADYSPLPPPRSSPLPLQSNPGFPPKLTTSPASSLSQSSLSALPNISPLSHSPTDSQISFSIGQMSHVSVPFNQSSSRLVSRDSSCIQSNASQENTVFMAVNLPVSGSAPKSSSVRLCPKSSRTSLTATSPRNHSLSSSLITSTSRAPHLDGSPLVTSTSPLPHLASSPSSSQGQPHMHRIDYPGRTKRSAAGDSTDLSAEYIRLNTTPPSSPSRLPLHTPPSLVSSPSIADASVAASHQYHYPCLSSVAGSSSCQQEPSTDHKPATSTCCRCCSPSVTSQRDWRCFGTLATLVRRLSAALVWRCCRQRSCRLCLHRHCCCHHHQQQRLQVGSKGGSRGRHSNTSDNEAVSTCRPTSSLSLSPVSTPCRTAANKNLYV